MFIRSIVEDLIKMAAPSDQPNLLPSLFNELHRYGADGEYDKALKVIDKSKFFPIESSAVGRAQIRN